MALFVAAGGCSASGATDDVGTSGTGGTGGSSAYGGSGGTGTSGTGGSSGTGGTSTAGTGGDDGGAGVAGSGGEVDGGDPDATDGEVDAEAGFDAPPEAACQDNVEQCDGLDNNCNNEIDEGDPGGGDPCVVPNKLGICAEGTTHCQNGEVRCIQDVPASAEICDGLDNNCDGVEDNNTTDTGDSCNTGLLGVCAAGTTICDNAAVECEQNLQASTEVCNGLDDDCDGTPDQGFPGSGQPCTVSGQNPNTPCSLGQTNCLSGQNNCTQTVFPSAEICDGVDNDCDGTLDNPASVDDKICNTLLPGVCSKGRTQCAGGVSECIPDVSPSTQVEICDGLDNDCNGAADDVANINLECATKFASAQNVTGWGCTSATCQVMSCSGNYKDCDFAPANGCEVNGLTDINHCGQCGKICSSINGQGACSNGVCQVQCNIGYGNCDGNADNGCELSLTDDVNHCGSCTKQCSATNGTPSCNGGVCQITCDPGYGNCDGDASNGCETDLGNTVGHCGTCDTACDASGGTPSCSNGTCSITCNTGYANCDGDVSNGCEVNLATDPVHCGTCVKVCDSTHGTASCTAGACGISCATNWANCDGNVDNGCEADLLNSSATCGSCTNACSSSGGSPSCNNGTCGITCSAGLGDCTTAAGCETNILSDVNNCGGCGNVCSSAGGTPTCNNGTCGITCTGSNRNCDNNVANGCEVNIAADVDNCGACGTVCSQLNGNAYCSSSVCQINCTTGWGDCTSTPGCETNTTNNINNCGGCGNACSSAGGTPSCSSSNCNITCDSTHGNCDGSAVNGCEINLTNNEDNCGTCGHDCDASLPQFTVDATCVSSQCEVAQCQVSHYDNDDAYSTGCECAEDAYPNSCTSAQNAGTVNYGVTVSRSGNLAEPGDSDWWVVTFQQTKSCSYSPKIVLGAGSLPIRMQVFPSCTSGAGTGHYNCKESNPNYSDSPIQTYEVEAWDATCGSHDPVRDTSVDNPTVHATDGFFEDLLPSVTYVRVYQTGSSSTCMNYTLTFTN